jgi:hypothetical protein
MTVVGAVDGKLMTHEILGIYLRELATSDAKFLYNADYIMVYDNA